MIVGFDRPLYVLPFDHRGSFESSMFGWKGRLTAEQSARIAAAKRVIYDGFKTAVAGGVPKDRAGILVDEQFGAAILRDAAGEGYVTAVPAEKSGQKEFDFEYGDDFARHIEKFAPTFCKVLVRYNPEGDRALNERQAARLRRISDYLHRRGRPSTPWGVVSQLALSTRSASDPGAFGVGVLDRPAGRLRAGVDTAPSAKKEGEPPRRFKAAPVAGESGSLSSIYSSPTMAYTPKPIDTSRIELPPGIHALTEALAHHNHDLWARKRLAEGWTWGSQRRDIARRHPDLVPFDALPDIEKDYDRQAAIETLRAILSCGYTLLPPAGRAPPVTLEPAPNGPVAPPADRPPAEQAPSDVAGVVAQWRARDQTAWAGQPELYPALASYLRRAGEPLLAYDVALEGLGLWPNDVPLRQLLGLVLADLGCAEVARGVLEPLAREAHANARTMEETLGILARVYKDNALGTHDAAERRHWLRKAYRAYARAHERTGGYWTGINAATMAALLGLRGAARTLAANVRRECQAEIARLSTAASTEDQYWLHATLGEAALIERRPEEACAWYTRAVAAAPTAYRWIASSRRNAQLLSRQLDRPWDTIACALPLPRVVVFAGDMIDRAGRPASRFGPALEAEVQAAIAARLDAIGPAICYASASCRADILFLEAALERRYEVLVVPPCPPKAFRNYGVDIATGQWGARLDVLLRRVHLFPPVTLSRSGPGSVYYDFANRVLLGLALQRARELGAAVIGLAALDGETGDGPGATKNTVNLWRRAGIPWERIDVEGIRRSSARLPRRTPPTRHGIARGRRGPRRAMPAVRALLFADVKDFSKMPEEMAAPFVRHVFGLVRALAQRHSIAPISRESRGDGFYLVFARIAQAGRFALMLSEHLQAIDWARICLPVDLTMRIALHAGPVLRTRDPVTGRTIYIGTHVNRVARIEAVTPPGQVYASQEFAALAALEDIQDFACHYVGQIPLAKRYGTFPMYHVRRLR